MSASKLDWEDRSQYDAAARVPGSNYELWTYFTMGGEWRAAFTFEPRFHLAHLRTGSSIGGAALPCVTNLEQAKEAAEQWLRAGVRDGSIDPFRAVREWAGAGEVVHFKWERSEKDPDFLRLCRIESDGTPSAAAVVWSGGKLHEAGFHGELTSCPFGTQACAVDFVEKQAQKRQEWARGVTVTCRFDRAALEVT